MADSSNKFELERAYERDELAAVFRTIANALADEQPLRIADRDRTATITIPPRVLAALEVEREADADPSVAELELELEWDDADGSTLEIADRDSDTVGVVGDDDSASSDEGATTTEPATDSEMATMPPDAVAGAGESPAEPDESTATANATADQSGSGRTSRFEVYEDRAEEWRWRLVHWNGNIVADSGEGYTTRSNAKRAARSVMHTAPAAVIKDL